jgi:predicted amidophosphoribosyltransferase
VHFDNRMMFALEKASAQFSNVDRRELILCKESFQSSHLSGTSRPSKDTLKNNMEINEDEVEDLRDHIILFDDIITAGAHFKACKELIQERFPTKKITGVFIARRDWDA